MKNIIKNTQNIMRKDEGIDGDAQRISQLAWLLFLKVLDDQEKELEVLQTSFNPLLEEKYQWRNWAQDEEGMTGEELIIFVDQKLFPYLLSLKDLNNSSKAAIVSQTFTDNYNFIKSGTILRQVINEVNKIDFTSQTERHVFGVIYETFLQDLQSAGNAGEYYTPRAVTNFIVHAINPSKDDKVLDPAMGTGGFLKCYIDFLRNNNDLSLKDEKILESNLFGIEKKPIPYVLGITNMFLNFIQSPINIKRDNALSWSLRDISDAEKFDVIVTNPPFGGKEEDGIELNFPEAFRSKETADLFLFFILTYLKEGGKCGIVFPDGFMSGMRKKQKLKEKLFNEYNVHTIVRLPNYVFYPYTDISTNILFFEKGEPTKKTWFYEQPYPEDYKYTKKQHIRFEEFEQTLKWMENPVENPQAWCVSIDTIKEKGFNIDFRNPNKKIEKVASFDELIDQLSDSLKQTDKLLKELKF